MEKSGRSIFSTVWSPSSGNKSKARFVERRKLVSPFFSPYPRRNYEIAAGATPASRRHPASNRIRAPPPACAPYAARKQIGSYNPLPRNDYVFSCNVCNGGFKHEGGGGRRGESDLVDINRIRERWLDATGLFSIMTKISPVLDTKSVRLSRFFSPFLFPFLFVSALRSEEREREREIEWLFR